MRLKLLVVSHPSVLEVNRTIFRELARTGNFEIILLAPSFWKGDLIQDLRCESSPLQANIRIVNWPIYFSGNGSLYCFRPGWKHALPDWSPDLVFLDEEPWSLSALQIYHAFPRARKCFFTKQNLKKKIPLPFQWIQNWIFQQSNFAFSVASEVTEVLHWKKFKKPIFDLPHSYDPSLFKVLSDQESLSLKETLHIPSDKIIVSYFGRLTEEKGIEDLLRAQHAVLQSADSAAYFFLWVGNGPLKSLVETELRPYSSTQTRLLPAFSHDQVGRALGISDLLILPSRTVKNWKEQFGRILVEAMAAGSAVLGSDSGEIPHLIRRAGGGLTFSEKDIQELTHKIQEIIQNGDLLTRLKKQGNDYVNANLTHASVAKSLASHLLQQ